MSLDELIINFQNKDVKAFNELYNMYSESMHGVIFNIIRDQQVAEEVLQDVFIKAWNNADSYSSEKGRFFTWLINIARNAAIDKLRSKSFKQQNKTVDATSFVDIFESHDNLVNQVDSIGIRKFVANLGEKCKSLIDLLFFKGYTQKEASEELETPLGTIKTNSRKCISELREIVLN